MLIYWMQNAACCDARSLRWVQVSLEWYYPLVRLMPLNAMRHNFKLETQPKLLLRVTVCVCCCCGVQCEWISPVNPIWPINSPVSLFAPCHPLSCWLRSLSWAVIMASHFSSRDLFLEGCCMEAPLSSVQEHLSAPLCSIHIHRYMWRSTSAPYCLGLNKTQSFVAFAFAFTSLCLCLLPWG